VEKIISSTNQANINLYMFRAEFVVKKTIFDECLVLTFVPVKVLVGNEFLSGIKCLVQLRKINLRQSQTSSSVIPPLGEQLISFEGAKYFVFILDNCGQMLSSYNKPQFLLHE